MVDMVNKPKHYIGVNGMEVEEVLQNFLPKINDGYVAHRIGSAVEYLLRHPEKNGDEDILKAKQNIEQIAKYQERKLVGLEDLQQGNEMNDFLKALAKTQTQWTNYFVPSEVNNYRGGTNPND